MNSGDSQTHEIIHGATTLDGNSMPPNHLILFVKAGKDGESFGGCPFCHRMFMLLLMKANAGELTFTVQTVNMAKAPSDFKKIASRLPVVMHGSEIISDPDEMIQYVDEHFPSPPMAYDNVKAAEASMNVFSKFSFYIKDVSHSPVPLVMELRKLNNYLDQTPYKFLTRDIPDHLDCMMLPKLQHIRVVSKAFKEFDIPDEFTALWSYLCNAYHYDVFRKTCPSDQEIVYHWQNKPELATLPKDKQLQYSSSGTPRYSYQVPSGIKPSVDS